VLTATIKLPPKLVPIFNKPRGSVQYRAAYGGRGSGKSYNYGLMAAVWGYAEPLRVLATREIQVSIKESFHAELKAAIAAHDWLSDHYDVGVDYLRGANGTEFIFRGLRHGVNTIKSLAAIDLTIVEEAEDVPEPSWLALEATVFRRPQSELWAIWNPKTDNSPVDQRFIKNPPVGALITELNWWDNPFFPENMDILRRREQERLDANTYAHVWEGAYLTNSNLQVLGGKWRVAEFEISKSWDGPYQGGDFGFSQDPTAGIRCYINGDTLMISHEVYRKQLELDDYSLALAAIEDFDKYVTRWDNARPENISYLKRHGLPKSEAVEKWQGSVEDGIAFLRSFKEIVIHERCVGLAKEARLYSHKVDRKSGDILPEIVDAYNHGWDAVRYALAPIIRLRGSKAVSVFTGNY
jgi:phage terminase large subunit